MKTNGRIADVGPPQFLPIDSWTVHVRLPKTPELTMLATSLYYPAWLDQSHMIGWMNVLKVPDTGRSHAASGSFHTVAVTNDGQGELG